MFRKSSKYENVELASVMLEELLVQKKDLTNKIRNLKCELKEANVSKTSMKPRFKELKNEKLINLDKRFNIKLLRAKVEKKDINKIYDEYEIEKIETIESYDEKCQRRLTGVESDIVDLNNDIHNNVCLRKLTLKKYKLTKKYYNIQKKVVSNIKYEAKTKYFLDKYNHDIRVAELNNKVYAKSISEEEYTKTLLILNSEYDIVEKLNLDEAREIFKSFDNKHKSSVKTENINRINAEISKLKKEYSDQKNQIAIECKAELAKENAIFKERTLGSVRKIKIEFIELKKQKELNLKSEISDLEKSFDLNSSEKKVEFENKKLQLINRFDDELKIEQEKFDELFSQAQNLQKDKIKECKLEHDLAVKQIKFLKLSKYKTYKDGIKELKNEKHAYNDSLMSNKEKIVMKFYVDAEMFQTRFKSLNAIKVTFLTVFPIILLGAFTTLFTTVIFGTGDGSLVDIFNVTLNHETILWLSRISKFFQIITSGTNGVISLYIVIVMSYNVSKNHNQNVVWISTITSVIAFFLLSNDFLATFSSWEDTMGTNGMITAIVLPIVIVKLFSMLENAERLKFKLPASIPDAVAKSLNALVPMFILLTSVSFFAIILRVTTPYLDPILDYLPGNFTTDGTKTLAQCLSLMIAIPMNFFFELNLYVGVAIFLILTSFIWWCGINSSAILGAFMWTKFGAGAPESAFKDSFFGSQLVDTMIDIGGSGGTFALMLVVAFLTRRSNWKMVTRIALIPALFGINEPILFGLPIVFNPVMLVPFILAPLAAAALYVLIQGFGIMDLTIDKNTVVPWTAPPIFGAYWSTGSWTGAVFAVMVITIQSLIYTPFVMLDNNIYKMSLEVQSEDKTFSFKKDAIIIIDQVNKTGQSAKLDEYVKPQEDYAG